MTSHLIARPRLVRQLNRRWHYRAVLVVAGPGFGKSVALAEAVAENALAPRGTDLVVECSADDRGASSLVRRIAAVAGVDVPHTPPPRPIEWLHGELTRRWPLGACVLLDDVHLTDGRTVRQLVAEAPASLHFVLTGRSRPGGLAELRAAGEVVEIGEEQLRLDSSETTELARANGVDPAVLAGVGGWPAAAAMAAAYGIGGAEEYLFEAVVERLDARHRRLLAIALALGGGDAELLAAASGDDSLDPVAALDGLPLVRHSERGEVIVHDLWRRALGEAICPLERDAAVSRAVTVLAGRGEFDRAFHLCAARCDWEGAARVVRACCRRGHAEVLPDIAESWLSSLPADRWEEPDGLLLRGLVGRLHAPFADATVDVLERAVAAFRRRDDVAGEVAAGVELVYVLRNQGRTSEAATFIARAIELDELGHPEAAGPATVGRAVVAELCGDDAGMIAALERVPAGSLSHDWQIVVAFRAAMGHLVLGNEKPMLAAAGRCAELAADDSNDRHVEALARWFAGDPDPALAALAEIIADARRSGVDTVFLGSLAAMVAASAGQLETAADVLSMVDAAARGPLSTLLEGAVVGVRALAAAASGDDDEARALLTTALEEAALEDATGWRRAVRWLPLAYVLVPATREHLDVCPVGAVHRRRLDVARAVVWALERRTPPPPGVATISASSLCTSVPLPWAMAFAARLTSEGRGEGGQLARELLDHFGDPAKDALRAAAGHASKPVARGAKQLLSEIAAPPTGRTVLLSLLGPTTLDTGTGATNAHWKRDRVRSLLVFLALRRSATRDQIIDALWPHLEPEAAERNLRVTLCYLQQVLEPERRGGEAPFFVRQDGPLLSMAGAPSVRIDVHDFDDLVRRADDADEHGMHSVALELLDAALEQWRGPCLVDVAHEDWAQLDCQELDARFVRVAIRAAQLHLAAGRTRQATRGADRALRIDRWCESAYQLKIAAALQDGDRAGAAKHLTACDAMLAELGVDADERTRALRNGLHSASPDHSTNGRFGPHPNHLHAVFEPDPTRRAHATDAMPPARRVRRAS